MLTTVSKINKKETQIARSHNVFLPLILDSMLKFFPGMAAASSIIFESIFFVIVVSWMFGSVMVVF
jgi:hypothetical protein